MKIQILVILMQNIPLQMNSNRPVMFVKIINEKGSSSWGEIAPLPRWSKETIFEAFAQIQEKQLEIEAIDWHAETWRLELRNLNLLPSVSFGVESAILSLLLPLPRHLVHTSALLMGSIKEIFEQAYLRKKQGYTVAKLKVGHLSFKEAAMVIDKLKNHFKLRIDVNRAWETKDSLRFFSKFPQDLFSYVEEPFKDPKDLGLFTHPLGIDESFPADLSLVDLESLPLLKALIYKPTIQGGMLNCLEIQEWAKTRGVRIVLSSSFESSLGLGYVASIAKRLSLESSVGIGTYHYLEKHSSSFPLRFYGSIVSIPPRVIP